MITRKRKLIIITLAVVIVATAVGVGWQRRNTNTQPPNTSVTSSQTDDPKEAAPTPSAKVDADLERKIAEWADSQSADYSIAVRELNGDMRTAFYKENQSMVPASTYKLFVAYNILHHIENDKYTLQTKTRTGATINKCLELMIVNSDNECGRALGFMEGWQNINNFLKAEGFNNTDLNNYDSAGNLLSSEKSSTAADEAELVYRLGQNQLLNNEHTTLLLDLMKKQVWRERLAKGLPPGVTIASKPGWLTNIQTDAGIVYGPKSNYAIVVMSNASTPAPFAKISKIVYDHLQQ